MDIGNILKNNQAWVKNKLNVDSDYFKKMSQGQNPKVLYIGCSDSRVTAEEIMGAEPGEIFVHRNIANMVVSIDLNVMSVINYAVDYLNVDHIIVCGHYGCGGVQAAMQSKDMGILNPWLRNIRDVYRLHKNELDKISDDQKKYERLVELNVQEQAINIIKTAAVQKAYRKKGLRVYGWIFDMYTGLLKDLNIDFEKILEKIMEIYHLD
ncbi:MAG: carbonic anhydrase [Bdellovibrionales bacterium]|nr:carbonic anhydrase [Bdellovibrionales bacterium]